jgi:hypothetical protein
MDRQPPHASALAILERLLKHAVSATRLVGSIDDGVGGTLAGPLFEEIDAITHELSELLGSPHRLAAPAGNAVENLRQLISKAEALANATEDLFFDGGIRAEGDEDRRRIERLAHLVSATAEAVLVALEAGDKLAEDLATHRTGA